MSDKKTELTLKKFLEKANTVIDPENFVFVLKTKDGNKSISDFAIGSLLGRIVFYLEE